MKRLLLLATCLVAFASSPAMAQAGIMGVAEAYNRITITIIQRDGQREEKVLAYKSGELAAYSSEYQALIMQLYREGYTLKSQAYGGLGTFAELVFKLER